MGSSPLLRIIIVVYRVRVLKPFRLSHLKLGPLSRENLTLLHVNKGADQSGHLACLMRAFVICSLERIIAKQLNLAQFKASSFYLVYVNELADFSMIWLETLKKCDAARIEPAHYPSKWLLFKLIEGTFMLHVFCQLLTANVFLIN